MSSVAINIIGDGDEFGDNNDSMLVGLKSYDSDPVSAAEKYNTYLMSTSTLSPHINISLEQDISVSPYNELVTKVGKALATLKTTNEEVLDIANKHLEVNSDAGSDVDRLKVSDAHYNDWRTQTIITEKLASNFKCI